MILIFPNCQFEKTKSVWNEIKSQRNQTCKYFFFYFRKHRFSGFESQTAPASSGVFPALCRYDFNQKHEPQHLWSPLPGSVCRPVDSWRQTSWRTSTHESSEGKQLLHFWAQLRIFHRFAPKKKDLVLWQDRSKCKAQIKNLWAASYWKIKPLQFNKFCFILWFYLAPGLQLSSDLLKMKQSMLKEDGKKNFSWKRIFLGVHWFY